MRPLRREDVADVLGVVADYLGQPRVLPLLLREYLAALDGVSRDDVAQALVHWMRAHAVGDPIPDADTVRRVVRTWRAEAARRRAVPPPHREPPRGLGAESTALLRAVSTYLGTPDAAARAEQARAMGVRFGPGWTQLAQRIARRLAVDTATAGRS